VVHVIAASHQAFLTVYVYSLCYVENAIVVKYVADSIAVKRPGHCGAGLMLTSAKYGETSGQLALWPCRDQ
jgi:hypothetical protein